MFQLSSPKWYPLQASSCVLDRLSLIRRSSRDEFLMANRLIQLPNAQCNRDFIRLKPCMILPSFKKLLFRIVIELDNGFFHFTNLAHFWFISILKNVLIVVGL